MSHIISFLGLVEQYFQFVSKTSSERYQKNKLQCLGMVCFGGNDYYAKLTLSTFSVKDFPTISNLEHYIDLLVTLFV